MALATLIAVSNDLISMSNTGRRDLGKQLMMDHASRHPDGTSTTAAGPLAHMRQHVDLNFKPQVRVEKSHYEKSLSTDWEGKLSGGGYGTIKIRKYSIDIEVKNNEGISRDYWISVIEFSDRFEKRVRTRHKHRFNKISPGHIHTKKIELKNQEHLANFVIETFQVLDEKNFWVEKYDLDVPLSEVSTWPKTKSNIAFIFWTLCALAAVFIFGRIVGISL